MRLHYTSLPSPPSAEKSPFRHELQLMGREIDRSSDRCRKLTEKTLLSPLPSTGSPLHPVEPINKNSHNSNNRNSGKNSNINNNNNNNNNSSSSCSCSMANSNNDLGQKCSEIDFLMLLRKKGVVPDLIDAMNAKQVFSEVSRWNRHHADLIYSTFAADGRASLPMVVGEDTILKADAPDPEVLDKLPERGFLLTLTAIAVLCFPGVSLEIGFQRLMAMDGDTVIPH